MKFNTAVLHEGVSRDERFGATLTPIYFSSAFQHSSAEELADVFSHKKPGFNYTRTGNPTVSAFENRMTKLEKGIASIGFSSGMAAVSNALLNILSSGDHVVATATLYGGTIYLFNDLEQFGITTTFVRNNDFEQIENAIRDNTKVLFAETIGNPSLDVTDLGKLAEIAHRHNIPFVVDNTVATAYLVRPVEFGADVVINSSSKYINGNSTGISGVLTDSGNFNWNNGKFQNFDKFKKFGKFAFIAKLRNGLFRDLGACLSPQNAFYNLLGLETLALRFERSCSNALKLAKWIAENHSAVTVNYPGLETSPSYEIAGRILKGGYGSIITIRVGSRENAFKIMNSLKLAYITSNIGDTKTLVLHPASTITVNNTEEQRIASGVYQDLVRISVGVEDIEDLIEDFDQAFKSVEGV